MDPRRLLIFREVARSGSISGAARALGWTQPAVSQHLRALEREAGCTLLLRATTGVELTEPGRALLARADAVAGELHVAREELAELTSLRRGRVRLAAYPSAAATLVPRAMARLRATHPDVDVALTEAEPPEALALLESGDVDLALVFGYDDPGDDPAGGRALVWRPLVDEPVDLMLPPDHRLARRRSVAVADLADQPWIVGCVRCRAHTLRVCATAGFEPDVRHESDDYVVVQNLVAVGLGVALLPRTATEAFRHADVVVRPGRAFGTRTYGTVHREGALGVPATAALAAVLATG
ncbi:LysR substrate-binding domain-containing protein [Nocardioides sp. SYSU D00038]|uniref:LysR substrate-binding domain-containing protein n=1 Tax=Nocardioides sp. SYSU D00038 TaxID=2812554 RepID=UPI0019674C44|nr:LysR substrate-binding domain-containing protein [Nocardioides sp. SYSU D00038]